MIAGQVRCNVNANELKQAVREEVTSSFTLQEMIGLGTFDKFFDEVDVMNAYEEEWKGHKENGIREVYHQVWEEVMREGGIKVPRNLRECICDTCGNGMEVFYDMANDEYICDECIRKEDEPEEDEDEDED